MMGYTHYFEVTDRAAFEAALPKIVKDTRKIVKAVEVPVKVSYAKGAIFLNGVGDNGYEDFVLPDYEWGFCKTAQRPYDLVVTAILRRAQYHAGAAIEVSSDGVMRPDVFPANYKAGCMTMEQVAERYRIEWAPADRVIIGLFEPESWPRFGDGAEKIFA